MLPGRIAIGIAAAGALCGIGALVVATKVARDMRNEPPPDTAGMAPHEALAAHARCLAGDVGRGVLLLGEGLEAAQGALHQGPDAARWGWQRLRGRLTHDGPSPAPSVADLRRSFPDAGLPGRMVGTTVDDDLLDRYAGRERELMQQVAVLGANTVRLGAYWDDIQPTGPADANFAQLDAALAAAGEAGLKVVLTVGAKAPAWPEYHVPRWAAPRESPDAQADKAFRAGSLAFVSLVAAHVADDPTIVMWQVENEPFDRAGHNRWRLNPAAVAAEAAALRAADGGRRPVLVTNWSQSDRRDEFELSLAIGDVVGIDVYPELPDDALGLDRFGRETGFPMYALDRARQTGTPVLVAELQADDWDPYRTNAADVRELVSHLDGLGYRDLLFWRMSAVDERQRAGDSSLAEVLRTYARGALGR